MQFLRGISRQVGRRPQERYRKGLHSLSGYSLSSYHASCKDFRRQTTPLAYLGPESTHVNSISVIFRSCPGLHFRQPWRGIAVQARQLASHGTAEAPLSEGVAAALPDVNGMIDYPPMEKKPYEKILVANRGEIACRIFRTAERMGMRTVAVYSEADADSSHVQLAHEAVCIGPAASAKSYLNMDAIFDAIASTGAQAVHPGYGFLSENAAFVTRLETAGVAFVGPSASAMAAMGDKIESKKLAKAAGVNTVPGCEEVIVDDDHAAQIAAEVGYPVMLKASAGGGGKGMRIAWNEREVRESFQLCSAEATSSFADGRIFIERFIEQPRHIEVQIFGDKHGHVVHLPERECSIQRRNQKVIEEAPSTFVTPEMRTAMGRQAVALARAVGYSSAGTVEFLVDSKRNFYFLEMNTRLQVAAGERLRLTQERAIRINGWAVESRVYAEDPRRGSIGRLKRYVQPEAECADEIVRVDTGVTEGSDISLHYDPLISKLTTWGPDRGAALASMEHALDRYVIAGLNHNAPFLRSVISHPDELAIIAATLHVAARDLATSAVDSRARAGETATDLVVTMDGEDRAVQIWRVQDHAGEASHLVGALGGKEVAVVERTLPGGGTGVAELLLDGHLAICQVLKRSPRGFFLQYAGAEKEVVVQSPLQASLARHMPPPRIVDYSKVLRSPMPGALISVAVRPGQQVAVGEELAVVEAMKMRNVLRAERAATVKAVPVQAGSTLAVDQTIIEFE
eukprot:jgi/Mesen1/355/ME000001S02667